MNEPGSAERPLVILHVEDDPADAELAAEQLRRDGVTATVERVTSREEFERALARPDLDLVLSDQHLPGFSGVEALAIARERRPDLPFVLCTGTMGDEAVADVVRQGASDYVLKERLSALAPALRRAIALKTEQQARRTAEAALRESAAALRGFFDNVGVVCGLAERSGDAMRFVDVNREAAALWGRSVEEVVGRTDRELGIPGEIVRLWHARCEQARREGAPVHFAYDRPTGAERRRFEATVSWIPSRDGRTDRFAFLIHDVTARLSAERRLSEIEERFRLLAEHAELGFWFSNGDASRIDYVNSSLERIWGRPAAEFYRRAETWFDGIVPEDRERVRRSFAAWLAGERREFEQEYRVVRPDGSVRAVVDTIVAVLADRSGERALSGTVRDVTEQREAARLAARAQRLESIGTLAGGIAHDLNNSLTPILIAAELLRADLAAPPPAAVEHLEMIRESAQRGAEMVRQLLTFARGAEGERRELRPTELVDEVARIVRATFPKSVTVHTPAPGARLSKIVGDRTQLHQALLNLCLNARDAMPAGGELTLELAEVEAEPDGSRADRERRGGGWVRLRVRDSGEGIAAEHLEQVFDPFFTTKSAELGTGLGLSTTLGIVKGHGGFVRIDSAPGRGTRVDLYLPAAGSSGTVEVPAGETTDAAHLGRGELVLVVDDEAMVRNMLRALLERMGYRPLLASGGAEAMALVAEHGPAIRHVLCDQQMPGLDGVTLLRAMAPRAPAAQLVAMSGLLDEERQAALAEIGVTRHLHKPFDRAELAAVLDEGRRGKQATAADRPGAA